MTSAFQLTAGVRRSYLQHEFSVASNGYANGGPSLAVGEHAQWVTTPRYVAKYSLSAHHMLYASAAKGFRNGGENPQLPPLCDAALAAAGLTNGAPFDSDSLWSFEVGAKDTWLGRRLTTRAALYRIDWSRIQQEVLLSCTFPVTTNSGAAVSKGGELEADALLLDHLTLSAALGYEDAHITEATPGSLTHVGQPLNGVPKWSGSVALQYSLPLGPWSGFARGAFAFAGRSMSYNNDPINGRARAAYRLVDLRLGADRGPWEIALAVRNLFDVRANLGDELPEAGELPGRPRWEIAPPRTANLELRREF